MTAAMPPLRRRRAAAWRLPPLANGVVDPWPAAPGRNRRMPVTVELGRRTAWLYGVGVYDALVTADVPRMRCARRRTWCCPIDRLDDVLAVIEGLQGRRVDLVQDVA